ncbi:MAG: hypothetical protein ACRCUT_12975, partial [Spirochaetota bacterium]
LMLLFRYVPEISELAGAPHPSGGAEPQPGSAPISADSSAGVSGAGISAFDSSASISVPEAAGVQDSAESAFVPLGDYVSGQQQYGDGHLQTKGKEKLGKHILEEKGMKFEPKIMAEAIKTMMSKDQ